ncbi:MAG: polysaccharide deacetylase family protein [Bacteroidia bacterium]
MYHHIATNPGPNAVSPENFARQMDLIAKDGREVVSMDAYAERVRKGDPVDHLIAITFDDAYISFKEHALPVLEANGFPATVYVPTNFVGHSNSWDDGAYPIMDWEALWEVAHASGITIGSHGMGHRRMRTLDTESLREKTRKSREILQAELQVEIRHFSYPYGQLRDYDQRCMDAVRDAGYDSGVSTLWGWNGGRPHPFELQRLEIEPVDDMQRFASKISRPFHPRWWRQRAKNLLFHLHLRR